MIRAQHIASVAIVVWAALALAACANREHMSEDYGRKSRVFFARQHVHDKATAGSPSGLDSEEAALIQASYRESLGAEQASPSASSSSRVLLIEEPKDAKQSKK
jgi:hypothetical protein